jgi:hypothetical protein
MGAWWISNYDEAKSYLAGGRKKWDRPMYMRGLRLQQRGKDIAIADKWFGFDPIVFHPDGTLTIQAPPNSTTRWGGTWNPLRSQSVRRNIKDFSGLKDIFQRDGVVYIVETDAAIKPPKIQNCRSCRGVGKVDYTCWPDYCHKAIPCEDHPEITGARYWHYGTCEHGNKDKHDIPRGRPCYNCKGNGKKDYGSQFIRIAWDGSPIKIHRGNIVKQAPTELEKAIAAYVKPLG